MLSGRGSDHALLRFLCRNADERSRLLDMNERMRRTQVIVLVLGIVAGALGVGTIGAAAFPPVVAALLLFGVVSARLSHFRRPAATLAAVWLACQLLLALAVALAHGDHDYLLIVPVIPIALSSAVFPGRVVLVMDLITTALVLALGFGLSTTEVLDTPPVVIAPLGMLLSMSLSAAALREMELGSRVSAVTDTLTGLPNRFALIPRIDEIAHQTTVTGQGVAVIAIDVDHLKRINDEHGHERGDDVLREVARRLRHCLDAFDPIYRLGGEEFVLLLSSRDAAAANAIAERMRAVVADEPVCGLPVTVSLGVALSAPGAPFHFASVFALADAALYDAKNAGRGVVRLAGAHERADEHDWGKGVRGPAAAAADAVHLDDGGDRRSWLIDDPLQRQHLLELDQRLKRVFVIGMGIILAGVAASGHWFGYDAFVPPLLGSILLVWVQHRLPGYERPEYPLAAAVLVLQATIAAGFALAWPPPLFALGLLALVPAASAAVFPPRAAAAQLLFSGGLMIAVAFYLDAPAIDDNPAVLALPLVLLAAVGMMALTVGRSTVQHRGAASVDQLTGILNRAALSARVTELEAQSRLNPRGVAVLIADVDRFKTVNDRHGHAAGDAVLRELAACIRGCLRSFESVYRLGGEEFVILLAGIDEPGAVQVAERVRAAVRGRPLAGRSITVSIGVAACDEDEPFSYHAVFARADAALLQAKAAGRDGVVRAGELRRPVAV